MQHRSAKYFRSDTDVAGPKDRFMLFDRGLVLIVVLLLIVLLLGVVVMLLVSCILSFELGLR